MENSEGGDDEATVVDDLSEEEDLEVFQPTEHWQTLKPGKVVRDILDIWMFEWFQYEWTSTKSLNVLHPGQAVPAGSHVRLNLQTGQREVRLGEEQIKYWTHKHRYDAVQTSLYHCGYLSPTPYYHTPLGHTVIPLKSFRSKETGLLRGWLQKIRPVSDLGPHMKVAQNIRFHVICAVHTTRKKTKSDLGHFCLQSECSLIV